MLDCYPPWPEAVAWLERNRVRDEAELAEALRREHAGLIQPGQSRRRLLVCYKRLAYTLELLGRFGEALAVLEEGTEARRETSTSPGVQWTETQARLRGLVERLGESFPGPVPKGGAWREIVEWATPSLVQTTPIHLPERVTGPDSLRLYYHHEGGLGELTTCSDLPHERR